MSWKIYFSSLSSIDGLYSRQRPSAIRHICDVCNGSGPTQCRLRAVSSSWLSEMEHRLHGDEADYKVHCLTRSRDTVAKTCSMAWFRTIISSSMGNMMRPAPRKKTKATLTPLWESEARSNPNREGRARVLEAAATAFMERGYAATTLDHVAAELGTTKGQIYHYYRSKLDLYFDVAVGAFFMINERIDPFAEAKGVPAVERLHNVFRAFATEIMDHYPFHRVALEATQFQLIGRGSATQERPQARISALRQRLETKMSGLIEEAASDGNWQVASIPLAMKGAVGSLAWLIVWFDPKRPTNAIERDAIAVEIADFALSGLGMQG